MLARKGIVRLHPPARRRRGPGRGFTLIEIMIVVAILSIILAIALTGWIQQRNLSQARSCQENISKIDGAKEQWAMENNKDVTATPVWGDLITPDGSGYLKRQPVCPADGTYTIGTVNQKVTCTVLAPIDHNAQP